MIKQTLAAIFLISFIVVQAQDNNNLLLKKKDKTVDQFWAGSMIAFQLKDKSWMNGRVINIKKDSIYIKPLMIQYSFLKADTLPSFITGFALKNIYAFPKPNVVVDYDKGHFRINRNSSRVQAYWIKSGWIFRVGALGYAALNITNSIAKDDFSISNNGTQLSIAAAVLLGGIILNKTYKPKYLVGKRYHMEILDLSAK